MQLKLRVVLRMSIHEKLSVIFRVYISVENNNIFSPQGLSGFSCVDKLTLQFSSYMFVVFTICWEKWRVDSQKKWKHVDDHDVVWHDDWVSYHDWRACDFYRETSWKLNCKKFHWFCKKKIKLDVFTLKSNSKVHNRVYIIPHLFTQHRHFETFR